MQFKKKPVVVDAFQLTESVYHAPEKWPEWVSKTLGPPTRVGQILVFMEEGVVLDVFVRTLEGNMKANVNDWIIRESRAYCTRASPMFF